MWPQFRDNNERKAGLYLAKFNQSKTKRYNEKEMFGFFIFI